MARAVGGIDSERDIFDDASGLRIRNARAFPQTLPIPHSHFDTEWCVGLILNL